MGNNLKQKVYRKQTNTDKYIHWSSFETIQWKQSTLSTIAPRAHRIYSNQRYLDEELYQIGYPNQSISSIMNRVVDRQPRNSSEANESIKKTFFLLPYQWDKGSTIMETLSNELRRTLPENIKMEMI